MFLNQLSKHLKEYADKARQSAFSDTWEKELLNISAKVHVSRLEALKTQLRQQVEMLFAEQADVMQKSLGESYKSDYYHSAYEKKEWTLYKCRRGFYYESCGGYRDKNLSRTDCYRH